MMQFQVRKDDLSNHRLVEADAPDLADGEILLKVDRFGLTANNITYGVVGERIGYWNFFPPLNDDDGRWGIIPVWGFADVVASNAAEVPEGERLYGYFSMATHLVMRPQKVSETRIFDGSKHRSALPPVYNSYVRLTGQPDYDRALDSARMVLHPLYATSFCLHDFLTDNDWFGAEQIMVISASSKTAIGLAYALTDDERAPASIGMTSARNLDLVRSLGLYDTVLSYDEIEAVDAAKPTAIVDMSGSGSVLSELHAHLGDNMRYCSNVGVTHWSEFGPGPGFIRERSHMFFAPGHIQKRAGEWGKGEFEKRALAFWQSAAERSNDWLTYETTEGLADIAGLFDDLRDGKVSPHTGLAVTL
ncbi:DUF2855 family protein [Hoeflea prorocentri]|uniref:DUF2855 family protein n=1 Tax=Hoeflea prorocentri TaxID=1922333 RepID=A0A9X3UL80_9HYPH|nr:DUF2855 family protein [Hoeflea prorocentri]MCY6382838.1 DUF2855 family protein [Hoeflea prorocentri]MDA5400638.1 DUF2855 family protein [Hoeflea prorocentri]